MIFQCFLYLEKSNINNQKILPVERTAHVTHDLKISVSEQTNMGNMNFITVFFI